MPELYGGYRFEPLVEPFPPEIQPVDAAANVVAYELAFENEENGQTYRFACDEIGHPLVETRDFVFAVDNYRFVGIVSRNNY